jgi:hypothetical protein
LQASHVTSVNVVPRIRTIRKGNAKVSFVTNRTFLLNDELVIVGR